MNEKLHRMAAASYKRLIEAGAKTVEEVPAAALPYLRDIAPELFEE